MIEWYLNLSFFDAVLVWLKLLLPVLFLLIVAVLMSTAVRWFVGDERLPRPKLPTPTVRKLREAKPDKEGAS